MKTAEQIIAEKLESAETASVATNESLKSLTGSLSELSTGIKGLVEKLAEPKEDSKLEEFKSELALVKAKIDASNAGSSFGKTIDEKSINFVKEFAQKSLTKSSFKSTEKCSLVTELGTIETKSLRTFDNSSAGAAVPNKKILGDLNVVLQTVSPVTSIVNNVSAGNMVAGDLGYKTFDPSYVAVYESNENEGKTETPNIVRGDINIHLMQNSAKVKISDKTLHSVQSGELTFNPIIRELDAVERFYEKKIARQVLNGAIGMGVNGIFPKSQVSGFKGKLIETINDNYITLQDLARLPANLKSDYLSNAAILIDRKALYDLYFDEAADGHLKIEQFDYKNGIAALRTPEGVIPLIGVDSDSLDANVANNNGFGNYTSFKSSSTILSGYSPRYGAVSGASDNAGKALAVLADFNMAYTLCRSSVVQMGYDSSFRDILNDGYVWGGKIGYVGGTVTVEEAINVLYCK